MIWTAVLLTAAGCYGFKLGGWLVPARLVEGERVGRAVALLPAALLAALVVVQTFGDGRSLQLGARSAGLAVAALALALRAPFLVVVLLAAGTAAAVRLI